MIVNCSRVKTAVGCCWRRGFNQYHRGVEGQRSMNLVDGGAFHEALARGFATPADKNWERALADTRPKFDEGIAAAQLMPEQSFLAERHWQIIEKMVQLYRENFQKEEYQVLQPECNFDVALPNSHHNCIWVHWWDREEQRDVWGPPPPDKILRRAVVRPHPSNQASNCKCWQPHRLVGKADALVKWRGCLWLMEHKTTAIAGEQFWSQWELDIQPTTYMYGIWKSIGLLPHGFVLDAIYKPSEKQVAAWNNKRKYGPPQAVTDYMGYERQAFLRTCEDLERVELQYLDACNEWERRIVEGSFPMNGIMGHGCMLYNRKCDYWTACLTHDDPKEFEALLPRPKDYVEDKRTALLVQILAREEVR